MRDYIPKDDAGKVLWLNSFSLWLTTNGAAHGFTPAEMTAMATAAGNAAFTLGNNATEQAIAAAIALARDDAQRLQTWPTTTDAERAAAGITIADTTPTARGGIPTTEATWMPLEIDTESPIIHAVPETVATTYAYRARYVGKNLKFGPFGDPVVCTVSV